MPQHAVTDHVSAVKPSADLSTSADTSNSSNAPVTTVSNDEQVADAVDADMETSMTTTADVQVHEPQQRDSTGPRHVRFDYYNSVVFSGLFASNCVKERMRKILLWKAGTCHCER